MVSFFDVTNRLFVYCWFTHFVKQMCKNFIIHNCRIGRWNKTKKSWNSSNVNFCKTQWSLSFSVMSAEDFQGRATSTIVVLTRVFVCPWPRNTSLLLFAVCSTVGWGIMFLFKIVKYSNFWIFHAIHRPCRMIFLKIPIFAFVRLMHAQCMKTNRPRGVVPCARITV